MKKYVEKMKYLLYHQHNKCSGCGKTMAPAIYDLGGFIFIDTRTGEKIDFAHNLSNRMNYRENYPKFIDSILNGSAQHNKCNVGRLTPLKHGRRSRQITPEQAERAEKFLNRHSKINKFVNNPKAGLWDAETMELE